MEQLRYIAILTLVLSFTGIVFAQGPTNEIPDLPVSCPKPPDPDPDKWQFQFSPYLWIAGINGRTGLGNLVVDVDAGLADENVDLNFGLMGTFEARKKRFIILTDFQ